MPKRSETTPIILQVLEERKVATPNALSEALKIAPNIVSMKLFRLWRGGVITRSKKPIKTPRGRKEYVYGLLDLKGKRTAINSCEENCSVLMVDADKDSSKGERGSTRSIIKQLFAEQKTPEPLFPDEVFRIVTEEYGHKVNRLTVMATLNKMTHKYGELDKSKRRFEKGYLYHPDYRVMSEWIQKPPYKGLSEDERCLMELVRQKTVVDSPYVRREAAKGKNLPVEYAVLSYKIDKLKDLIPWLRTEQYGSVTILYNAEANPDVLEEKLSRSRFWVSEEGKRKRKYGYEFEDYCRYIFHDIVHEKNKEWYSTNISAERNKKGRHGEYDLIIEHTLGPPEFGLRETIVFEFKAGGRIKWDDVLGYDKKTRSWGFVEKLKEEMKDGIFEGKFVRPILVLAHTIESGLPYALSKEGVFIIYKSDLLAYLRRKEIDPEDILKAIGAEYYK